MENVLLTAANSHIICEEGLQSIQDNYVDDVNGDSLKSELLVLEEICKDGQTDCFDVLCLLKSKEVERGLLLNVQIVVEFLLINPATSAAPERSFSLFFLATLNDDRKGSIVWQFCMSIRN